MDKPSLYRVELNQMVTVDYTPAQAAAATGLSLAAVHKAIDARLIKPRTAPGGTRRRLLSKQ